MSPGCIVAPMMLEGIHLDRASRISLREQLVGQLEARILGGQIGAGHRLPSVRRVEELLGIHRNTVAAAYRDLVLAGLVRTRPGSGVYVRSPSSTPCAGVGTLVLLGPGEVAVRCADASLQAVLEAELRARFAFRVASGRAGATAPGMPIRLALPTGFLRGLLELQKPALVAVVSECERVQRLAASAVLVHGGEGIACLPVAPGDRRHIGRFARLASLVVADHATLPWARHALAGAVRPLRLISGHSASTLTLMLRRYEAWRPASRARRESTGRRGTIPAIEGP